MQYIYPDLIYYFNCLSSNASYPSAPVFQRDQVPHLLSLCLPTPSHHLSSCPWWHHHPWPLSRRFPVDFHSQKIFNSLVCFADVGQGRALNDKIFIACVIICIFGVAVHLSAKTHPVSAAHYTCSDVCTFYLATKMVQWIRPVIQNIGLRVCNAPTPIYKDI